MNFSYYSFSYYSSLRIKYYRGGFTERIENNIATARKLFAIYSLNVLDWIFTVLLLRTGDFYEANPLMSAVIGDLNAGFLVKCVLPAALLLTVRRLYGELGERETGLVDGVILFVLALYAVLCSVHIVNLIMWSIG